MQRCALHTCAALSALAAASVPVIAGDTAFKAHCRACHLSGEKAAAKIKGATEEEKRADLAKFLETHQKTDPAIRPELIDYLISLTKQPNPAP